MNGPDSSLSEEELLNRLKTSDSHAFLALYDRYASALLGVIIKIVGDQAEAIALLEETFIKVCSEMGNFHPEKQPLFVWLLTTARCTALDALSERKPTQIAPIQLTTSGQVVVPMLQINIAPQADRPANSENSRLKELLDAVLFKNCTPEEAATLLGIPIASARQQLRVAVQQLRASQKA